MRIDSHQHFWQFDPVRDAWIDDSMQVIRRDFLPADLQPVLEINNIDGCVAVQADQSENETKFLLDLAAENDFVKGVVGWIDLRSEDLHQQIEKYKHDKKLKGFRHIVQAEKEGFLLQPEFIEGVKYIGTVDYTYDILIFPNQLLEAAEFAAQCPDVNFVLDHIAKPYFKNRDFEKWEEGIRQLSELQNVHCKVSGLVTEADWKNWQPEDFDHCLNVVAENFGADRLMFGSDWPVCLLAGSYEKVVDIFERFANRFSPEEQTKIWGTNAINFYNLNA